MTFLGIAPGLAAKLYDMTYGTDSISAWATEADSQTGAIGLSVTRVHVHSLKHLSLNASWDAAGDSHAVDEVKCKLQGSSFHSSITGNKSFPAV